ncbi:flagellar brake protein [Spirosoma agri]|uniref:Flagellar brake protein n=1 Tax=Spirosoma agri TaxID=1987381 RepID=A0A6M0IJ85_9BACT|nr:flagellar brake protein [Spirosoma agri]NEU68274.1 flagellar brake protein [Spirosoma agri]
MSLLNDIYQTHLQTLLGKTTRIEEIDIDDDFITFALPVDQPLDLQLGVKLTIYGINEGKLYCSIFNHELEKQLADLPRFDALKQHIFTEASHDQT